MNILFVSSSPRGADSYSHQVAQGVVDGVTARHPEANVVVRDVAKQPLPHIGEAFVRGEAQAVALSNQLIDEVQAADLIVIAAPMHNFGIPSTLKAWFDHVVRAKRTFTYGAAGPQGLMTGKRAVIVVARGGVYSAGPAAAMDFQETYLRTILGFIGITDVEVVRVEGVATGEVGVRNALAAAQAQSQDVLQKVA